MTDPSGFQPPPFVREDITNMLSFTSVLSSSFFIKTGDNGNPQEFLNQTFLVD